MIRLTPYSLFMLLAEAFFFRAGLTAAADLGLHP